MSYNIPEILGMESGNIRSNLRIEYEFMER
jgi:hypothetical protein